MSHHREPSSSASHGLSMYSQARTLRFQAVAAPAAEEAEAAVPTCGAEHKDDNADEINQRKHIYDKDTCHKLSAAYGKAYV